MVDLVKDAGKLHQHGENAFRVAKVSGAKDRLAEAQVLSLQKATEEIDKMDPELVAKNLSQN